MQDPKNENVFLEPFSEKHLELTFEWMQDEQLKRDFLFASHITAETHKCWFESYSADKSQAIYAIYFDAIHVGNVGLKDIDRQMQTAETWIYVGDSSIRNRGIAFNAYKEFLSLIQNNFQLKSLYCYIASFNAASEKLYRKVGFVRDVNFQTHKQWKGEEFTLYKYVLFI